MTKKKTILILFLILAPVAVVFAILKFTGRFYGISEEHQENFKQDYKEVFDKEYIEKVVGSKRDSYDICYDHDTFRCKPFFDFMLEKGFISKDEREIISKKTAIDKARLEQERSDPNISKERRFEISNILYGHHFTEDAKNMRREALNRYFYYVEDQLKQGVAYEEIIDAP